MKTVLTVDDDGILTFPDELIEKLGWKEGDVTFSDETVEVLKEVREWYQKGKKDDAAFAEFMRASAASAKACGKERIVTASKILEENFDVFPEGTLNWGVGYLMQFL